jgi:hypothetical protein
VSHSMVDPLGLEWITRPHEPDEPARHVAELSEAAGFAHTRGTPPESEHAELLDPAV